MKAQIYPINFRPKLSFVESIPVQGLRGAADHHDGRLVQADHAVEVGPENKSFICKSPEAFVAYLHLKI
jgi:hypothetical protein